LAEITKGNYESKVLKKVEVWAKEK
jgi:hypothetical protein